ncbi:hypothetical protein MTR_7g100957 [Medicago truncatula]|uniref:Uncharacterized protein n=1 Tax=Medicago truncatula TaxID=3880 RepID=A0A072U4G0_MEDTR|nr:hypothetical protein MTR_7g100957 [Medicago truncatula]
MASKRCLCSTDTSDQRRVRCNCIPIVHFLKLLTVSTYFLGNPKISINQTSNRRMKQYNRKSESDQDMHTKKQRNRKR